MSVAGTVLTRSQKKSKKSKCAKKGCYEPIDKENDIIECESCDDLFHISCFGLNENVVNALKKYDNMNKLIFCCENCLPTARKLMHIFH